jgi:tetratricopeptide (TPR) repeat protein
MRTRLQSQLLIALVLGASVFLSAQTPGRDLQKEAAIWAQLEVSAPGLLDTFKEATARMDEGKYPEAATLYQKVVDGAPRFDPAVRRLGICLVLGGDVAHGLPIAEKALSLNRSPENLASLAQLLIYRKPGIKVPREVQQRALSLALEAQGKNIVRDPMDTVLVASLALDLEREKEFREATEWLAREHPELMQSHYLNAILAVMDSHWGAAEEEIREAGKLGLDPKVVDEFLQSGIHTRATVWRYARYSAYLVALWAVGLLLLFVSGRTLSQRILRSTDAAPTVASSPGELSLRRTYRRLINLAGLYYYISQPIVVFLVIAVTASVIYGFYMMGRLPVQLIVALVIMAITTVYFMIKSLLVKQQLEDPGRALKRDEAPGLWALTSEVARDVDTRPVDQIRITPGTDLAVYEKGTRKEKSQDTAQRVLILGVGVLNGFRVSAFRAILGHEYGHFTNRDTAGGEIALRVNRDMVNLARAMIAANQNSHLNLGFQFLRLYHFLFRRISHGASRLQEIMADRVAAMQYGAGAFEEGLRHVIRCSEEFAFVADREAQAALESGRSLHNLYDLTPERALSVEESIQNVLSRPTTDDDTHPCPNDRFRMVRGIITPQRASGTAMVWDLFADRQALTAEMTQLVGNFVRPAPVAPRPIPEKTGMLDRCAECGRRIVFGGYTEGLARYCSTACYTGGPFQGFCEECTSSTTEDGPGNTHLHNGIGTSLRPRGERCPKCHSVLTRKWVVILLIPVIPLKEYRVRWINHTQYVGRRLRPGLN